MRQITCDELRRELPISEWWAWAGKILTELRETSEGRKYMRFHKGPVKRFKEEVIRPCGLQNGNLRGATFSRLSPQSTSRVQAMR